MPYSQRAGGNFLNISTSRFALTPTRFLSGGHKKHYLQNHAAITTSSAERHGTVFTLQKTKFLQE
jgi:hypothetical protein